MSREAAAASVAKLQHVVELVREEMQEAQSAYTKCAHIKSSVCRILMQINLTMRAGFPPSCGRRCGMCSPPTPSALPYRPLSELRCNISVGMSTRQRLATFDSICIGWTNWSIATQCESAKHSTHKAINDQKSIPCS